MMERVIKILLWFIKRNAEKTAEKASPRGTFESVVPKSLQKEQ